MSEQRIAELEKTNERLRAMVDRAEKQAFNWMNRCRELAGQPYLDYIDGERPDVYIHPTAEGPEPPEGYD